MAQRIQPIAFPLIGTATILEVKVQAFDTDANTCTISYTVSTDLGRVCVAGSYTLTQTEYDNWGSDNQYVNQIAANAIGVQII